MTALRPESTASTSPHATVAPATAIDRRAFMAVLGAIGAGATSLSAQEQEQVTKEMIAQAEQIVGLEFNDEERTAMVRSLDQNLRAWAQLREVEVPNAVSPALHFDPVLPGVEPEITPRTARMSDPPPTDRPNDLEQLAFLPVRHLAELIRTGAVKPTDLTTMYLERLKRHGPTLEAVITLTEERALDQARAADRDIAAGAYRGPLHGIPWGAKDLLAVSGHPTTWGAAPYREQTFDEDATVVRRLDDAGAILVAKLTLGALAQGDVWFGGRTRNPWNLEQGSSGSSAGSAAATMAGLVGFAIGTETLGSIVSPSTRTGATGLRPTYGRVSRHGAMALSWSMDKIGPIGRTVEDCALVFDAIHGDDGHDPTARSLPFAWDARLHPRDLRIGYYARAFEGSGNENDAVRKQRDDATLAVLRSLGVEPVAVDLPTERYPLNALRSAILSAEAAAAFDELTRSGRDDLLERSSWPNTFRQARFIPAVEYIQANRIRSLVMRDMHDAMANIDVLITPSYGGDVLVLTNLTGHPAVVVPNAHEAGGSISFIGRLYGEAETLAVAKAVQDATAYHTRIPPLFAPGT